MWFWFYIMCNLVLEIFFFGWKKLGNIIGMVFFVGLF